MTRGARLAQAHVAQALAASTPALDPAAIHAECDAIATHAERRLVEYESAGSPLVDDQRRYAAQLRFVADAVKEKSHAESNPAQDAAGLPTETRRVTLRGKDVVTHTGAAVCPWRLTRGDRVLGDYETLAGLLGVINSFRATDAELRALLALAASATPPTPEPVPYAETLAFLERVAADFAAHADRDPVSADTVTYCRVAAEAVRRSLTAPAAQEGATITEYTLGDMEDRDRSHLLVRVRYSGRGKWAVCRLGDALNRDGEWEWEPLPSSRDDAFFARCRFDSAADAIAAARKVLAAAVPRGGDDA